MTTYSERWAALRFDWEFATSRPAKRTEEPITLAPYVENAYGKLPIAPDYGPWAHHGTRCKCNVCK